MIIVACMGPLDVGKRRKELPWEFIGIMKKA